MKKILFLSVLLILPMGAQAAAVTAVGAWTASNETKVSNNNIPESASMAAAKAASGDAQKKANEDAAKDPCDRRLQDQVRAQVDASNQRIEDTIGEATLMNKLRQSCLGKYMKITDGFGALQWPTKPDWSKLASAAEKLACKAVDDEANKAVAPLSQSVYYSDSSGLISAGGSVDPITFSDEHGTTIGTGNTDGAGSGNSNGSVGINYMNILK